MITKEKLLEELKEADEQKHSLEKQIECLQKLLHLCYGYNPKKAAYEIMKMKQKKKGNYLKEILKNNPKVSLY